MKISILAGMLIFGVSGSAYAAEYLHGQVSNSRSDARSSSFSSDVKRYGRVDNPTYGYDGSGSTRAGNDDLNSDGTSSTQFGNRLFNSDGSSVNRGGGATFDSNSKNCTQVGNSTFCY